MRRLWLCTIFLSMTACAWAATRASRPHATVSAAAQRTETHAARSVRHDVVLLGDKTIEHRVDRDPARSLKAVRFRAKTSGRAGSISVFVASHSRARTLLVGLYNNKGRNPGSLLATASLSSPKPGAWREATIKPTAVKEQHYYWVALLAKGGPLYFRARGKGSCRSLTASQTRAAVLPSSARRVPRSTGCPISVFISGQPGLPSSTATQPGAGPSNDPLASGSTTRTPALRRPSNTSLPAITGTAQQGETLTTNTGSWSGSPTAYRYQWQHCSSRRCSNINGATSSTYTLQASDVGDWIEVVVTASNAAGSASATSAKTAKVSSPAAPPTSMTAPSISGAAQQGQTLSASNGSWTGSSSSYAYQWQDCSSSCANIGGATKSTYTLQASDVGDTVDVVVRATNAGGSTDATSAQTQAVKPTAPSNTAAPSISGAAQQGQTLSASNGSWTGSSSSYAYQWQDCSSSCANIGGATKSTYTLQASDVGDTVDVVVRATNAGGSTDATSAQTQAVKPTAPSNTAAPSISGAAQQGQTLSASNGSWTGSSSSYAYQWQDCSSSCANIGGATKSTYTLQASDVGDTVDVVVTATNAGGSTDATSAQTQAVKPTAPSNTAVPSISGAAQQGQTLSASNGSWTGSPSSYAYQWRRCDSGGANCSNIGSNASSYPLVSGDSGSTIRVIVTATNAGGWTPATSAQTGVVSGGGTSYAPAYVQSNATLNSGTAVTTSTSTFASSVTSGDLIVVGVAYRGDPQAFTLTDTLGTVFHAAGSSATTDQMGGYTGRYTGQIEWGVAPAGGADTVSVSFPVSTGHIQLHANEYNAANPQLDATAQATGSGTTVDSGPASVNHANETLFGLIIVNNTVGVATNGFTERGRTDGDIDEDKTVSSLGSYNATATSPPGGTWSGQEATFWGTGPNIALPGQPMNVTATSGALSANVSWTAPASGGAPDTYIVTPYIGASAQTPTNVSAPATSTTVNGLTAGTAYTFTVTASNAAGRGTPSAASNSVTPTSSGSAPVNTTGPYFTASTGTTSACSNGCAIVGQTLGVDPGAWTNNPSSYTYQWQRCTTTSAQPPTTASCSAIGGATSSTYTVQSADTGHSLVPIVTAYSGSTASSPTGLSGTCDTGEMLGAGGGTVSARVPNSAPATCSPISAVVNTTQGGEKFCTNAVTTCGYADPMNGTAGVPAGTALSTTGACSTYASGATISSGTVTINGCRITGSINITGGTVTIENSDIAFHDNTQATGGVVIGSGATSVTLQNDTIHGIDNTNSGSLAFAVYQRTNSPAVTEDHVFAYNIDRLLMNYSSTSGTATVTDSVCWNNVTITGEHYECIYTAPPSNLAVHDSFLINQNAQTGVIFSDGGTPWTGSGTTTTFDLQRNLMGGGDYCVSGGQGSRTAADADRYVDNRFTRAIYSTCAQFGLIYPGSDTSAKTSSGNVWDDTGATASP